MKNNGLVLNKSSDNELNQKCLKLKNIEKGLNLNNPDIRSRIQYGFLMKRHKAKMEYYQKRWCFIISSRPLNDDGYENDEMSLDNKKLPSWMNFDVLYYYKVENEDDKSEFTGTIIMK